MKHDDHFHAAGSLTPADTQVIITFLHQAQAMLPFLLTLLPEETKALRNIRFEGISCAQTTSQELLRLFERVLLHFPGQWEDWLRLHHADEDGQETWPRSLPPPTRAPALTPGLSKQQYTMFWGVVWSFRIGEFGE